MIKNLWRSFTQKDSLWGKWVNLIKLKGGSIWDVNLAYNDSWGWKCLLELRERIHPHFFEENGSFLWITNDDRKVDYSTSQVWSDLRINKSKVAWSHVIWFKGFEPKHAFILWLAALNRLNTQDRISKWMPNKNLSCCFCGMIHDSINHLFFRCDYSDAIWKKFKSMILFRGLPNHFEGIVNALAIYPFSNNISNVVNRIVFAACVYFIWNERNGRLFKLKKKAANELYETIYDHVRFKLVTMKIRRSAAVLKVAQLWNLVYSDKGYSLA
ncbi:uncharacterized protein [Rutidosis leptorrhynchoides]|uniref:uncharacterized protein n=1 Tax=Rutidosis leptorrhynchoides TaxID=125765 RepID=UPI003A991938